VSEECSGNGGFVNTQGELYGAKDEKEVSVRVVKGTRPKRARKTERPLTERLPGRGGNYTTKRHMGFGEKSQKPQKEKSTWGCPQYSLEKGQTGPHDWKAEQKQGEGPSRKKTPDRVSKSRGPQGANLGRHRNDQDFKESKTT